MRNGDFYEKAMSKDFFREIKYTFNRYVSILLIVALGVAFLAGIRATCPDMKLSLDYYLDQSDFMDLRVLSTLGLTDDDLQAISSIEGVKAVEGAYSYDAEVIGENAKWILRFLSEPQNVNKISLVEGRDIENPDECIVDRLMIDKDGYQIGDQLTVTAAGKDENVSDTLSVTTLQLSGQLPARAILQVPETQLLSEPVRRMRLCICPLKSLSQRHTAQRIL